MRPAVDPTDCSPTAAVEQPSRADGTPYVDKHQPIVFQVGRLGKDYWTWVNLPEGGHPRFFGNTMVEGCTKTPWWVVPLLWLPLFTYWLLQACLGMGLPLVQALPLLAVGVVAWQLLEYCIHRFAFHAEVESYWGVTLHFLFHGCHHKYPMDKLRLVFPPVPASALVALVYVVVLALFKRAHALAIVAGMGYGYVAYDCIHYFVHHGSRLPGPLAGLKRRHMYHHYKDHSRLYGISSMLFDAVFQTL